MANEVLSSDEIGRRIALGIAEVHSVLGEVYDLLRLIQQLLTEQDDGIQPMASKGFLLPRNRKKNRPADRYLRTEMGWFAELDAASEEESQDEEDDELSDQEEGDDDEGREDRKTLNVAPDRRFLGIRTVLMERDNPGFRPLVVAAVFTSLSLVPRRSGKTPQSVQTSFSLKRASLKRIVKALGPRLRDGSSVSDKVSQGQLTATITACRSWLLADFESKTSVDKAVSEILGLVDPGKEVDK